METKLIGKDKLGEAAALIVSGELVAVPTETVYGLACSGLDAAAVERVYEVKGRPEVKPLSLMLHKGGGGNQILYEYPKAGAGAYGQILAGASDHRFEVKGHCSRYRPCRR